jgi:hypothetical protein
MSNLGAGHTRFFLARSSTHPRAFVSQNDDFSHLDMSNL